SGSVVNPFGNALGSNGWTHLAPTWSIGTSTSAVDQFTWTGQVMVGTWATGEWAYHVSSPKSSPYTLVAAASIAPTACRTGTVDAVSPLGGARMSFCLKKYAALYPQLTGGTSGAAAARGNVSAASM